MARAGVETRQGLRPNRWWSGASVRCGKITIATLCIDADGHACLDPDRSVQFELKSRDQKAVMELCIAVGMFVDRMSLTGITLRIGPSTGPKVGKAQSHICEAVLYLIGVAPVVTVNANSLGGFMRAKGYEVGSQARDQCWQYAFGAAAYAAERDGVEVKFQVQE